MPQAQDGPIQLPKPLTRCAHASSRLRLLARVSSSPCGSAEGLAPYGARVLSAWPDGSLHRWLLFLGRASSLRAFLSHAELPSLVFNDMSWAHTHRAELSYQVRQSLSGMSKPLAELQELGFQPVCGEKEYCGWGRARYEGEAPGGRACGLSACQQRRGVGAVGGGHLYAAAHYEDGPALGLSPVVGAQVLMSAGPSAECRVGQARSIRRAEVLRLPGTWGAEYRGG